MSLFVNDAHSCTSFHSLSAPSTFPASFLLDFRSLQHAGHGDKGIAFLRGLVDKYVRSHRMWFGPLWPNIFIYHTEHFKKVARSSAPKPMATYNLLKSWLGECSLKKQWNLSKMQDPYLTTHTYVLLHFGFSVPGMFINITIIKSRRLKTSYQVPFLNW